MSSDQQSIEDAALGELLQLVTFRVGLEEFAVDILNVQEIIRVMEVTVVPSAPNFVEGVINLRGRVIPVVDLRRRFGLGAVEWNKDTRINVIEIDGAIIGFIVDSVNEVLRIPGSTVEPPPPLLAGIDSEFVNGIGKLDDRLLILLDLNKVIASVDASMLGELQQGRAA